jgi:flagellin
MPQVINTNIMSLNAQRQLDKSQRAQNQAMERLSSGLRVNSAKDDAAGLSIATGMESQTRGLNQAIRNANDGISMAQTAEGAMDEMTNIMQRMRELAVQSANDTNSSSNRASIQKEVDQLYSELDRIANTTQFNGVVLLNGSSGQTNLQIGANAGESLSFSIDAVTSKDLNLNAVSGLGELNGGRIDSTANITASSITINGVVISANGQMSAGVMETAINAKKGLTGVTANAYNVLNGTGNQNGVTSGLSINGTALGATASMQDLVNQINQAVPGVVATIDKQGGLSLTNDTGAAITVASGAQIGLVDGTYGGYLSLTSADGSEIKTGIISSTGTTSDLQAIGFNVSTGSDDVQGGSVLTTAVAANDGIKINGIELGAVTGTSAADKAFAINALRDKTGVEASAKTEVKLSLAVSNVAAAADMTINGTQIDLTAATTLDSAISLINQAGLAGIVASADKTTGQLVLTSQSGQDVRLTTANNVVSSNFNSSIFAGEITLKGDNGRDVVITSNASDQAAQAAALDKLGLTSQGGDETAVGIGLSVLTAVNASNTIERIDDALNKISDSRSNLGAVQNRLTSTISNLANVSQNTAAAKSRIMDADFAAETSQMSKAQVLQQAGTAMLAQANASNQSVLSLLKG